MVLTTTLGQEDQLPRESFLRLLLLLNPFAPHIAEELWSRAGKKGSITLATWPTWDDALCIENEVEIVVQVNGKVRARFEADVGTSKADLEAHAFALDRVKELIEGKEIKRVIVVPDKIVNIVVVG